MIPISYTKEDLEKKVTILKKIFILGIILIIISFCCMGVMMFRLHQLQNELDDLDRELHDKPPSETTTEYLEEYVQKVNDIDQERDFIWILMLVVGAICCAGFSLFIVGSGYKRLRRIIEEEDKRMFEQENGNKTHGAK